MNESQLYTTRKKTDTKPICYDLIYMIFFKRHNYSDSTSLVARGWGYEKGIDCKG